MGHFQEWQEHSMALGLLVHKLYEIRPLLQ